MDSVSFIDGLLDEIEEKPRGKPTTSVAEKRKENNTLNQVSPDSTTGRSETQKEKRNVMRKEKSDDSYVAKKEGVMGKQEVRKEDIQDTRKEITETRKEINQEINPPRKDKQDSKMITKPLPPRPDAIKENTTNQESKREIIPPLPSIPKEIKKGSTKEISQESTITPTTTVQETKQIIETCVDKPETKKENNQETRRDVTEARKGVNQELTVPRKDTQQQDKDSKKDLILEPIKQDAKKEDSFEAAVKRMNTEAKKDTSNDIIIGRHVVERTEITNQEIQVQQMVLVEVSHANEEDSDINMNGEKETSDADKLQARPRRRAYPLTPAPLVYLPTDRAPNNPAEEEEVKKAREKIRESVNYGHHVDLTCLAGNEKEEILLLQTELEKLHADRKVLRERLGWNLLPKYKQYSIYDIAVKQETVPCFDIENTPPGCTPVKYLVEERTKILSEIFSLTSLMVISDENKTLRSQISTLEKQMETTFADLKNLSDKHGNFLNRTLKKEKSVSKLKAQ